MDGGKMKTMAISTFKAHALEIIARIYQSKEHIIITKRGEPLAEIIPYQSHKSNFKSGKLAKTLKFEKDIITPLGGDMWEVNQ